MGERILAIVLTFLAPVHAVAHAQSMTACALYGGDIIARCGTIHVPEDHSEPKGRTIALQVIIVPATVGDKKPDPVFLLAGGPGQAATEMAERAAARRGPAHQARDLVFVDQRGTGYDSPLRCEVDIAPTSLTGRLLPSAEVIEQCLRKAAAVTDVRLYTTEQSARDLDLVRSTLGYSSINLEGGSYGTRVALEYLRLFSDHVRTAALSGAVPPDFRAPLAYAAYAQQALNHLFDDCAADPTCVAAFPDVRTQWAELLTRLRMQPVSVTVTGPAGQTVNVEFTANDLAYTVRTMLYGAGALDLPLMIHDAWRTRDVSRFSGTYLRREAGIRAVLSAGLHLAVVCTEDVPFITDDDISRWTADTYLGPYIITEYRRACRTWPRAAIALPQPVASDRPVLVISGRRDPSTPAATGAAITATLSNSLHVVLRFGGHGFTGLLSNSCEAAIRDQFLRSGSAAGVDTSCVRNSAPVPFRVSWSRTDS
jgi:pimeloyl-ACP methyl ester carboxylesterase